MPGYRPKKRLGQNFLKSERIISRMVDLLQSGPEHTVVEVGPGRGALTLPLVRTGARVIAVEIDADLIGYLNRLLRGFENATVTHQDFLDFDPSGLQCDRFALVGNLPYHITSPVIEWVQRYRDRLSVAILMVQREVADRLCSSPGNKDWSPIAIFTQQLFKAERLFNVPPSCFHPRPKVSSSVVRLIPQDRPAIDYPEAFERLVRLAFRQRRKLLVNNLMADFDTRRSVLESILTHVGLARNVRAEQVSAEQFLALAHKLTAEGIL